MITTIDELEQAHRTVRKFLSLPLRSPSPSSPFISFFSLPGGDFQPPPPLIPSSNRENTHCLSSESGAVQKYREFVDSRRVASRITYRARINPRRLYNLSLFPCVPFPSFAHRHFFLPSPYRPVRPSSWSFSRIDVTHACLQHQASRIRERSKGNTTKAYIPRIRVR